MNGRKYWLGQKHCDLCEADLTDRPVVDGKTRMGPWAVMCDPCHATHGVGLGPGRGQRYEPDPDKQHMKVQG